MLYQKLSAASPITSQTIYKTAASFLHQHITLDDSVSPDLGCAEAVTFVLNSAGVAGIPPKGIAGTAALYQWLRTNKDFNETSVPVAGDIVISPSGTSTKGVAHGHVGICANYGILSNDSNTGLFSEKYNLVSWQAYFGVTEGFPVYYYHYN